MKSTSISNTIHYVPFQSKLVFLLIVWLAACPLSGQAHNEVGIRAYLENDRLLFELNARILDQSMLFVRHGQGQQQVVRSRQEDHIHLTVEQTQSLTGTIIPVYNEVSIRAHLIGRYPLIKERSTEQTLVIDVTGLFFRTNLRWWLHTSEDLDPQGTFIENIWYLAGEIIIKTRRTINRDGKKETQDGFFSFYALPEPMVPRLFDQRMGFGSEADMHYNGPLIIHETGSITRWRLEKKHPEQVVSEPIKPIVFYLDPAMPDQWKPYVRAGVLDWLPAFEAAGFKNAIEVRNAPEGLGDAYLHSVNYSMIRWKAYKEVRGSVYQMGSSADKLVDWRSGEILNGEIKLIDPWLTMVDDYLIRCAALDPRARQYTLPEDLMGALIREVTAHEAGHTFGIRDANYGEFAYPVEKVRNSNWLREMGHTPSVMSYTRHNNIAQPEDSIPPDLLIPKVGPMDIYHITWGYKPFPEARTPEEELPYLEELVRKQDSVPWYRYTETVFETLGPAHTNEVVETTDPVASTDLALKNLKRTLELLPAINRGQRDDAVLQRLHEKSLELWFQQMSQVASLVGGYTVQYKSASQPGAVFTPIPREAQRKAVDFLLNNAFEVPAWLSDPPYLPRIRYSTNGDMLLEKQWRIITELLDAMRMKRLVQMEEYSGSYEDISGQILTAIREGLFRELEQGIPQISRRRQELQRTYVGFLAKVVEEELEYRDQYREHLDRASSDYVKGRLFLELLTLKETITGSLEKVKDRPTLGHLRMCLREIDRVAYEIPYGKSQIPFK